jgi:hypothetical protein
MEIWKEIPGYEDLYEVSNLGNVNGLKRNKLKEQSINTWGYKIVTLSKNCKTKTLRVHQLVAMAFLNHKPNGTQKIVVDHINDIKTDNRVENLHLVTQRFNSKKTQGKYSSQYKGVHWSGRDKRWLSQIQINGKLKYLGLFNCELAASIAYQNKLKTL